MRLVYKKYSDGTYKVYTTDDSGENERVLEATVPPDHKVRRVPFFIEVNCDDDQVNEADVDLDRVVRNIQKVK